MLHMNIKAAILGLVLVSIQLSADVLHVGVTIPPQQEPVKAVMGTNVVVHVLMDGNQNPHFFRPSAKRLSELAACDLYFTIGFPGEENVEKKFSSIGTPKLVSMIGEDSNHHHHHHHHHHHGACGGDVDTHYWTSPLKLKEFAHIVCEEACILMPESAEYFKQNLHIYEQRCNEVIEEGRAAFKSAGVTHILTYHPALGNYASAMGLTQLAIEKGGRPPTIGVIADIVTTSRKFNIQKIFVQNSGEAEQSKVILRMLNASAITIQLLSPEPLALIQQITFELTK